VIYVARQLGHDARRTLSTYGHVMDEFEDTPRLDAPTAIAEARAAVDGAATSTSCRSPAHLRRPPCSAAQMHAT
jgi:hypothetical protein